LRLNSSLNVFVVIKARIGHRIPEFALQMRLHLLGRLGHLKLWAVG